MIIEIEDFVIDWLSAWSVSYEIFHIKEKPTSLRKIAKHEPPKLSGVLSICPPDNLVEFPNFPLAISASHCNFVCKIRIFFFFHWHYLYMYSTWVTHSFKSFDLSDFIWVSTLGIYFVHRWNIVYKLMHHIRQIVFALLLRKISV